MRNNRYKAAFYRKRGLVVINQIDPEVERSIPSSNVASQTFRRAIHTLHKSSDNIRRKVFENTVLSVWLPAGLSVNFSGATPFFGAASAFCHIYVPRTVPQRVRRTNRQFILDLAGGYAGKR